MLFLTIGMMENGDVFLNVALNYKFFIILNVFVEMVWSEMLMEYVNTVPKVLKLVMENAFAQFLIIGVILNGDVFLTVTHLTKSIIMDHVSVKMVWLEILIKFANTALKALLSMVENACVKTLMFGLTQNGIANLDVMRELKSIVFN